MGSKVCVSNCCFEANWFLLIEPIFQGAFDHINVGHGGSLGVCIEHRVPGLHRQRHRVRRPQGSDWVGTHRGAVHHNSHHLCCSWPALSRPGGHNLISLSLISNSYFTAQVLAPRFERLNRSWVRDIYMNLLMKYPSFLMVIQVTFLHHQALKDWF